MTPDQEPDDEAPTTEPTFPKNDPVPTGDHRMTGPNDHTGAVGTLTDGTGVSAFTTSKLIKDIVLDFLLAIPAALLAINVTSLEAATVAPVAVAFAVGDVVFRVAYRAVLRWAQSPE